jgi:acyl-CoA synthetase (AMP-forming)/AMP-acid ligase II
MVVVLHPESQVGASELKTFCSQRLARYKVPKIFVFAESLPYSPYGKVMKQLLKQQYQKISAPHS